MEKHRICPWWHAYTFDNVFRRLHHKPERMFADYLIPGMKAMDIGCGMGIFSIGMARLLGDDGEVIAVDVQQKMLDVLRKRAHRAGVARRIRTHRCEFDTLNLTEQVDFILAFWMVHEVDDKDRLFREIRGCLKPGGKCFLAEPTFHVKAKLYHEILDTAAQAGLTLCHEPRVRFSRAAVFEPA